MTFLFSVFPATKLSRLSICDMSKEKPVIQTNKALPVTPSLSQRRSSTLEVEHGRSLDASAVQQTSEPDDAVERRVDVQPVLRRPEPLTDAGGARPDGVEPVGGVDGLGPHAGLSAEDLPAVLLGDAAGDVVVVEDVPGVVEVVEVPLPGDDDAEALADDLVDGGGHEPDVHDGARVHAAEVRGDLLPVHRRAVGREDHRVRAVHRVLVRVRRGEPALAHPLGDARRGGPAARVHLVAAQVEELVEEQPRRRHLLHEAPDQRERVLVRRVDRLRTLHRRTHLRVCASVPAGRLHTVHQDFMCPGTSISGITRTPRCRAYSTTSRISLCV